MSRSRYSRRRPGRAFTTRADGLWSDPSTWLYSNGDYPRYPGDTVTIAAGHEVTIPAGLTVNPGAVSCALGTNTTTDRTKLIIGGVLNCAGNVAFAGIGSLEMTAGAGLDLCGFNVTNSAVDMQLNFAGTNGSRCTVRSTGGRGAIFGTAQNQTLSTIDYTDFSGLANSIFGKSHPSSFNQHIEHCSFNDMSDFYLEALTVADNAGFSFQNNDVRNPHAAGAKQPGYAGNTNALGTTPRNFKNNTYSGGAQLGAIYFNFGPALTAFSGNVIDRFYLDWANPSPPTDTGNFWSNQSGDEQSFLVAGNPTTTMTASYFYYDGGNHAFGFNVVNQAIAQTGNIFESTGIGSNWFLYGASASTGKKIDLTNNLFLGKGTPLSFTGSFAQDVDFMRNTMYMSNDQTAFPGAADFGAVETEAAGNFTGTVNYNGNLFVDSNTNPGGTTDFECHITLRNAIGTQITSADYNGHAGFNNAGTYGATVIGYYQSRSNTTFTAGAHDVTANPLFVDKTRKLSTWDTSLGGAGTPANAIAEMLKLNGFNGATFNSSYSIAALIAYVKAGFQPSGAGATAFNGTGLAGANIGYR